MDMTLPYIPEHLHYMLFELLKVGATRSTGFFVTMVTRKEGLISGAFFDASAQKNIRNGVLNRVIIYTFLFADSHPCHLNVSRIRCALWWSASETKRSVARPATPVAGSRLPR